MAGSPSHSVRDIQEPPRSWVGVCTGSRTVPNSGRTRADVCLFRLQYVVDQLGIEQPLRNRSAVDGGGTGGQSRERPALAAGESEMSFPPGNVLRSLVGRIMQPHGATVRRAKSRRLTYCFDRLRMRTLGSLPAVPETPVVRNARQPVASDDRFHRRAPAIRQKAPPPRHLPLKSCFARKGIGRLPRTGREENSRREPGICRGSAFFAGARGAARAACPR
jgi:hypothetical protein